MIILFSLLVYFKVVNPNPLDTIDVVSESFNRTRRILGGHEVGDTRPYMVYLRQVQSSDPAKARDYDASWLCGGVIIHERYILTSAACIEDAKHFYVISGTHSWTPGGTDNECIKNGAKKAVWKCVPQSYVFDGKEFDNIRWMINDIAVVKVEDDFNFQRRVRGCDFIPQKVAYNNKSVDLEKAGTLASTAGWGSTDVYSDIIKRTSTNSPSLLETDVVLISKKNCKKRWSERYHHIIDEGMICGKDGLDSDAMSSVCSEHEVNCKELVYSDEDDEKEDKNHEHRRMIVDPGQMVVHDGTHRHSSRRSKPVSGGFCENDHGGPLVVGHGKTAVVVGVISACMSRDIGHKCYGPFLYTSVWRNRVLISCAIDKETGATCKRLLRATKTNMAETPFDWRNHADGPAKSETNVRGRKNNTSGFPGVLRTSDDNIFDDFVDSR